MDNEQSQVEDASSTLTDQAVEESGVATAEVTPEIERKFNEVFGSGGDDKRASKARPDGAGKPRPTGKSDLIRRKQEEAESLSSLDDAEDEDLREGDISKDDQDEQDDDEDSQEDEARGKGSKSKVGKDGSDATPTLDPVLRHAARRGGFTNDEIDQLVRENPELAERTFEKLHQSFSGLSAKYSQLAMAAQANDERTQQARTAKTVKPVESASEGEDLLKAIYGEQLPGFTEKWGEDFVGEVLKPLVDNFQRPIAEMYESFQRSQREQVANEASQFFKSIDSNLTELYGGKTPTREQIAARQELAILADRIRIGAKMQGEQLSVTEALDLACMSHAREHLGKIERKKLVEQVRRRSQGVVTRPSQRKSVPEGRRSGEKSIQTAIEAYSSRMAELGLGDD